MRVHVAYWPLGCLGHPPFGASISLAAEREAGDRSDTRGAPVWRCPGKQPATFELSGFLFLICRNELSYARLVHVPDH